MTFLEKYLESVKLLECPESYHVFAAMGMLSSLTGRKVWSSRGAITTFPNLYVCLIGQAGSGKTTAMRIARKILEQVDGINFSKKCPSARDTMDSVAEAQSEFEYDGKKRVHSPYAIFLSELSNFIALHPVMMVQFLTDCYDDDHFDYGTHNKGKLLIKGPALSMVACCTHQWITDQQKEMAFNDGIGRRVLWILDSDDRRNDWPEIEINGDLVERCKAIRTLCGPFRWNDASRAWWREWYQGYNRLGDQSTQSYFGTKHVQLEKVAMLLAMANRMELEFQPEDFEKGVEILDMMEKNLAKVFQGVGRNVLNVSAGEVVEYINRTQTKIVEEPKLRAYMFRTLNSREYDEVITHLYAVGKITTILGTNGNKFKLIGTVKNEG